MVLSWKLRIILRMTADEGSTVREPAYIRPHSVIGPNAYEGPYTSIGPDCHVVNSEIENSAVLNSVKILNVGTRITNSIMGAHSKITGADERSRI
jgi:glucose-1-phosphate thymidylyltransferase